MRNPNVLVLFFHCVLLANIETKRWQGTVIKRGSFVTSYDHLAEETGLSYHQVRTALDKLKLSELAVKTTNKYTVISVNNYEQYNDVADKWQTNGRQMATTKEYKKKNPLLSPTKSFDDVTEEYAKQLMKEKHLTGKTASELIEEWKDYHLSKGDIIKDYRASFRNSLKKYVEWGRLRVVKSEAERLKEMGFPVVDVDIFPEVK